MEIVLNILPIVAMIALIPFVTNDHILSTLYIGIILLALIIKRNKNDLLILVLGFLIMTASEYFFIRTGVETFERTTLFGLMPLWLPLLWGYGFVAIKRFLEILK